MERAGSIFVQTIHKIGIVGRENFGSNIGNNKKKEMKTKCLSSFSSVFSYWSNTMKYGTMKQNFFISSMRVEREKGGGKIDLKVTKFTGSEIPTGFVVECGDNAMECDEDFGPFSEDYWAEFNKLSLSWSS